MTTVRTTSGKIRGHPAPHGTTFPAIPYAPTPIGPSRFTAPGSPPTWSGTFTATTPATAPQSPRPFGKADLSPVLGDHWLQGDYLTLTVTTPDPTTRGLPVLVFLHGGGFTVGTTHTPLYDGGTFARDGVILVTITYRLGVLGWLDLPDAPSNRGLLDVLAALRWLADNIARFGGDPGNVTVAGQSSGAMLMVTMLTTSASAGLFHRGISQSGHAFCAFDPARAALTTKSFGHALGTPPTAAALADLSDARLLELAAKMPRIDHGFLDPSLGASPFKPVLDGELLTAQPADGVRKGIDLMIGTNAEEANLYSIPFAFDSTESDLLAAARRRFPDPEARIAACRAGHPDDSPEQLLTRLMTDAFVEANRPLLDAPGVRTFGYDFRWRSRAFGGRLGACHCVELPFVFDRVDLPALRGEHALLGPGEPPVELAARTHAAWVSFVHNGNPGWAEYDPAAGPEVIG